MLILCGNAKSALQAGQQWSLRLQTSKVVGWTGISLHETKGSYLLLIGAREF